MAGRLAGKRILVTAAGAGIGRATVLMMAAEGANVIATDVLATNGVIHAIDAVILPSDLATLVGYDPELATLGVAVGAADPSVAAALTDAAASYTLFAPVNAAFEAIDPALLAAVLADPVTLTDILLYHVFDGAVDAAAAIAAAGTSIDMVNGDPAAVTRAQSWKGELFVLFTAGLLNGFGYALQRLGGGFGHGGDGGGFTLGLVDGGLFFAFRAGNERFTLTGCNIDLLLAAAF